MIRTRTGLCNNNLRITHLLKCYIDSSLCNIKIIYIILVLLPLCFSIISILRFSIANTHHRIPIQCKGRYFIIYSL